MTAPWYVIAIAFALGYGTMFLLFGAYLVSTNASMLLIHNDNGRTRLSLTEVFFVFAAVLAIGLGIHVGQYGLAAIVAALLAAIFRAELRMGKDGIRSAVARAVDMASHAVQRKLAPQQRS